MDTTETITHLGLCAGYGGIELGLKRVIPTLRSVALCEIEAFAIANLVAKMEAGLMDPAPVWTNLKTFPWAEFRDRVDILTGGYPCQPFSSAGKRAGADDPRHLWPFISSGIQILRPRLCFFENVEGHISLGLREVIADLESLGYQATWGIFSAAEVGAPHQRKRVFIMAHRSGEGLQGREWLRQARAQRASGGHPAKCGSAMAVAGSIGSAAGLSGSLTRHEGKSGVADNCGAQDIWPSRPGKLANAELHGCDHANARSSKYESQGTLGQKHEHRQAVGNGQLWPSRPGEPQHWWEPPRVVGNAAGERLCGGPPHGFGQQAEMSGAGHESLGDAEDERRRRMDDESSQTSSREARGHADGTSTSEQQEQRQTQQSLVRNADGTSSWLDYAELCVSSDNRTDELRLLGNGVVPATAEKAFRTLWNQL